MFVIVEALYIDSDIDYDKLDIEVPEELLEFKELPLNLSLIEGIENCAHPNETIVQMASGTRYQLNITKVKLLSLIDMAGLLMRVPTVDLSEILLDF